MFGINIDIGRIKFSIIRLVLKLSSFKTVIWQKVLFMHTSLHRSRG